MMSHLLREEMAGLRTAELLRDAESSRRGARRPSHAARHAAALLHRLADGLEVSRAGAPIELPAARRERPALSWAGSAPDTHRSRSRSRPE
jgi:hypothetical protein